MATVIGAGLMLSQTLEMTDLPSSKGFSSPALMKGVEERVRQTVLICWW